MPLLLAIAACPGPEPLPDTSSADLPLADTATDTASETSADISHDTPNEVAAEASAPETSSPAPIDSDRDGIPDELELLQGTDPHDPGSALAWHPELRAHPRLFFDAAHLPALFDLTRSVAPGAALTWSRIRALAEATPPELPDPGLWDDHVATARARIAEAAAFVGLVTEDPTLSAKAAGLLSAPLPSPWPLNDGILPTSKYDLYESEALVAACHAFDLLAATPSTAALMPAVEACLTARVEDFGRIHLEPGAFFNLMHLTQNNHLMKVMGALGLCAIALPDRPSAAPHFNEAVAALTHLLLEVQGHPEGAYAEGWNYLAYGGETWLPLVWAYRRLVGHDAWPLRGRGLVTPNDPRRGQTHPYGDLAREATVLATFDNALLTSRPDGLMAPTDDANAVPLHGAILAALFERPAWSHNWQLPAVDHYVGGAAVLSFVALLARPEPAPFDGPLDQAFPGAGFAVFRSAWSPEASYVLLLAEHGPMRMNGLGHEHADPLSLLMHAHGEALLLDPGYIDFDHNHLVKHGHDHNIVLVDGLGPPFPFAGGPPEGDAFLIDFSSASGRPSALGTSTFRGMTWWRRLVHVESRFVILADRMVSATERRYTFVLHGHGGGEVPDTTFTRSTHGATWTRPRAALHALVLPLAGDASYSERLEEHAVGHGRFLTHAVLDVETALGPDNGFLAILWPSPTGADPPAWTFTTPSPGPGLAITLATGGERHAIHFDGETLRLDQLDASHAVVRSDTWPVRLPAPTPGP